MWLVDTSGAADVTQFQQGFQYRTVIVRRPGLPEVTNKERENGEIVL